MNRPHQRVGRTAAFTLIEILLALSITAILLGVAMVFYRQVADLRGQVLLESERLAATRLVFDRVAADLRSALPGAAGGGGFEGDSTTMTFSRSRLELGGAAGGGADRLRSDLGG